MGRGISWSVQLAQPGHNQVSPLTFHYISSQNYVMLELRGISENTWCNFLCSQEKSRAQMNSSLPWTQHITEPALKHESLDIVQRMASSLFITQESLDSAPSSRSITSRRSHSTNHKSYGLDMALYLLPSLNTKVISVSTWTFFIGLHLIKPCIIVFF